MQGKRKKNEPAGSAGKAAGMRKKPGGMAWGAGRKKQEKTMSAQQSIPYLEMARDGVCRVRDGYYSKTVQFYDINYQLGATRSHTNTILQGKNFVGA